MRCRIAESARPHLVGPISRRAPGRAISCGIGGRVFRRVKNEHVSELGIEGDPRRPPISLACLVSTPFVIA